MPTSQPLNSDAKPDDPAQSKRFIDMAREVEVNEDPEVFERAFKKVALHPRSPSKAERPKRAPK